MSLSGCLQWFESSPASAQVQALAAHAPSVLESIQAAPADTGQTGLAYFLGQQDAIQADAARLQAEMDDLQKKYAADPNAELRDEIRAREAFVARIQTERAEARKFVSPTLAVTLDWVARDAQEAANALKADLNARLRVPNPERAALKAQIDKLQQEIDRKAKLAKALAEKIKSLRDDRRREGVMSELDALAKTAGSSSLAGQRRRLSLSGIRRSSDESRPFHHRDRGRLDRRRLWQRQSAAGQGQRDADAGDPGADRGATEAQPGGARRTAPPASAIPASVKPKPVRVHKVRHVAQAPAQVAPVAVEDSRSVKLANEILKLPLQERLEWSKQEFAKRGIGNVHDDQ